MVLRLVRPAAHARVGRTKRTRSTRRSSAQRRGACISVGGAGLAQGEGSPPCHGRGARGGSTGSPANAMYVTHDAATR